MPNMTGFFIRYCRNTMRSFGWAGLSILLTFGFVAGSSSWASDYGQIEINRLEIVSESAGYFLNSNLHFELAPRLSEAVQHGVPLHFTTEIVIEKPRWYWFDKEIIEKKLEYRLSYNTITRSYRLSIGGGLHQNFDSLNTALTAMQRLRNWRVGEIGELDEGVEYKVSFRFRLDKSQLPKPFQVSVVGDRDWNLDTGRIQWTLQVWPSLF